MTDNPLLGLIVQRPLPRRQKPPRFCPACLSAELDWGMTYRTLLGWSGEGDDPNHATTSVRCRTCGAGSLFESKSGNHWVSVVRERGDDPHVVAGAHNCFEACTYDCAHCGGIVSRRYAELDGSPLRGCGLETRRIDGKWVRQYRTFWRCEECEQEVEV
jgi:hypothetical protein